LAGACRHPCRDGESRDEAGSDEDMTPSHG
jgi:hypothetical protein